MALENHLKSSNECDTTGNQICMNINLINCLLIKLVFYSFYLLFLTQALVFLKLLIPTYNKLYPFIDHDDCSITEVKEV